MTTVDEARAALQRGRPVVLVTPPAPDQAGALWELVEPPGDGPAARPSMLIICADEVAASEWVNAAPPTDACMPSPVSAAPSAACGILPSMYWPAPYKIYRRWSPAPPSKLTPSPRSWSHGLSCSSPAIRQPRSIRCSAPLPRHGAWYSVGIPGHWVISSSGTPDAPRWWVTRRRWKGRRFPRWDQRAMRSAHVAPPRPAAAGVRRARSETALGVGGRRVRCRGRARRRILPATADPGGVCHVCRNAPVSPSSS